MKFIVVVVVGALLTSMLAARVLSLAISGVIAKLAGVS